MNLFRLSRAAESDIVEILAWSEREFGEEARRRYEARIVAGLREAGRCRDGLGSVVQPELGAGVFSWHLSQSRDTSAARGRVRRPRHLIVYRLPDHRVDVVRILHEAMDVRTHVETEDGGE